MATVEQGLQAQIRNIEATYGKPMSEWIAIISASGLTKHTDVVTMFKKDYGMTHGAAHRVSLVARQHASEAAGAGQGSDPRQRPVHGQEGQPPPAPRRPAGRHPGVRG
jgi:hypothetical protein